MANRRGALNAWVTSSLLCIAVSRPDDPPPGQRDEDIIQCCAGANTGTEFCWSTDADQMRCVHNGDAVAEFCGFVHVVRGQDNCRARLLRSRQIHLDIRTEQVQADVVSSGYGLRVD